jgi:hypothetical protein
MFRYFIKSSQNIGDFGMIELKSQDEQKVVITDIRIPFWPMVIFLVKLVFASIPALIIFSIVSGVIMMVIMALFGTMWGFHSMMQPSSPLF